MTPEEAKPHTLWDYENKFGDESGDEAMFAVQAFTAKETAEIAKAYSDLKLEADAVKAWEVLFEEWSK